MVNGVKEMTDNERAVRILRGFGDPACTEQLVQTVLRGWAGALDAQEDGVLVYSARAEVTMLAWRTRERLEQMLARIPQGEDIALHGEADAETVRSVKARFRLPHEQRVSQYAYYGALPEAEKELDLRTLTLSELDFVYENYGHASREYLRARIEDGVMLGAYVDGALAGFIGEHSEGAMGLLHVMPEHRREHLGFRLERAAIRRTMLLGQTPFCQVFDGNDASHALQARLGMTRAKSRAIWLTREPF